LKLFLKETKDNINRIRPHMLSKAFI